MLGGYQILGPLGAGGMGLTFEGIHRATGHPVVLKTLRALDEAGRQAFGREVEAIARQRHRHVVQVFDYGLAQQDTHIAGYTLAQGSPFVLMARAPGRALEPGQPGMSSPRLRALLIQLLQTLRDVHACGVTHRDLKHQNIVVQWTADEPWLTLIDFGLAQLGPLGQDAGPRDAAAQGERVSGTLSTMAPEQLMPWASVASGPWSDLFSLGCLAYELITGRWPFWGLTPAQHAAARERGADLSAVKARQDLPRGLADWLAWLLEPDVARRARHAQRALDALLALDPWPSSPPQGPDGPQSPQDLAQAPDHPVHHSLDLGQSLDLGPLMSAPERGLPGGPQGRPRAPLRTTRQKPTRDAHQAIAATWPPRWPSPDQAPEQEHHTLRDAGLGVVGLREAPLSGRELERAALWEALTRALMQRRGVVATLRGQAGQGKSRLARALGQEAYRARLEPALWIAFEGDAQEAPLWALRDELGLTGQRGPTARWRASAHLAPLDLLEPERRMLLHLLSPEEESSGDKLSQAQALTLLARYLEARATHQGGLIVVLDDLHQSGPWLALLEALGASQAPLLTVCTLRQDALEADAALAQRLASALDPVEDTLELTLEPLPEHDQRRVLEHLLPWSPQELEQLVALSEGNPLFAHYLIQDWSARGQLHSRGQGFERADAADTLPERIRTLCASRLARAADQDAQPAHAARALEIAALLDSPLSDHEWRRACQAAGGLDAQALFERLVRLGLARSQGPHRWRLDHGMLRETLLRAMQARDALRWGHERCLEVLADAPATNPTQRRRARHLRGAQDLEGLLTHLGEHGARVPVLEVRELLGELELALTPRDQLHAPQGLRLRLLQLHEAIFSGQLERAQALRDQVLAHPALTPGSALELRALNTQAWLHLHALEHEQGINCAQRALEHPAYPGSSWRCDVRRALGNLRLFSGDAPGALEDFEQALRHDPDAWERAWLGYELAMTYAELEDLDQAEGALEGALGQMEEIADVHGVGSCLMLRGATLLLRDRPEQAEPALRQSAQLLATYHDESADMAREYLARALALQGRAREALQLLPQAPTPHPLDDAPAPWPEDEVDIYDCFVEDVRLACWCMLDQEAMIDACLDALHAQLDAIHEELWQDDLVQPMMRRAAASLGERGDWRRATRVLEVALGRSSPLTSKPRALALTREALKHARLAALNQG